MNRPAPSLFRPALRVNIWRTSDRPKWYAYQIYRDADQSLVAGGECRSKTSAEKEAQARIRRIEAGYEA